ncbi:GntR family transcriptional regulator [Tsukamurella sp. 1534]|uniref:GntR family transcriptional regulator n=1 Tax=Tsukamurella sp. 1534 TaxID=1151061 RepID=UPI0002D4A662|nr:GntR family transcriptional regulator [Tsukamurella sp. 1534]
MPRAEGAATAAERAHARIRDAILRGDHEPGTMLSENTLAADLEMSRTPVRAALTRLQDEGWVRIYPQRGAQVQGLSPQEIRESAQLRLALESAGVFHSDEAGRRALSDRLEANMIEQEQALRSGDFGAFAETAIRFHSAFVDLARNSAMTTTYARLRDRQRFSLTHHRGTITADPDQVLAAHRAVLDAAVAGDWLEFVRLLDDHQRDSYGTGL